MTPKPQRNHAYIHMRNRGYTVNIDYDQVEHDEAERIIKAVMQIVREGIAEDLKKGAPWLTRSPHAQRRASAAPANSANSRAASTP